MTLWSRNSVALSKPGQAKSSHILATTSRDKLPVAVIFKPGPEAAERSNNSVFLAMADCWVSTSVRSEARLIAQVTGDAGFGERPETVAMFPPSALSFVGSLAFGAGWGLAGFCPGPALASIATGGTKPMLFTGAMLGGMLVFEILERRIATGRTRAA